MTDTTRPDLSAIPPQSQDWPGSTADLDPAPDHGEGGYTGRARLAGKRALITGGDSGIGRAVAIVFAKEGADVAIAHLPEEEADAAETGEQVRATGRSFHAFATDLRTEDANVELARNAVKALGGIDVLVCNAAYQMTHEALAEFPREQIRQTFETNVFSPFWLVQESGSPTWRTAGSVVITTSVQAYAPSEHPAGLRSHQGGADQPGRSTSPRSSARRASASMPLRRARSGPR